MLLSSTSSDDAGKMWEVHGDRCPCFPGAHRDHWKNAQSCLDGIHRRKKIRLVTMFHQYLRDLSKKCVKMLVHQLAKHQAYDSYDGFASSSPWCLDQINHKKSGSNTKSHLHWFRYPGSGNSTISKGFSTETILSSAPKGSLGIDPLAIPSCPSYGKSPNFIGKSSAKGNGFHSYSSLLEGYNTCLKSPRQLKLYVNN